MSGQLIGRGYMTIVGLRDGDPASTYVLLPSVESVTKKLDGTLTVGEVYCSVYKVTGSSAYALSSDHTLTYVRKPDGATDILEHANGVSGSITVLSDTESIEFELSDSTNIIDRVRIPILSDATDVNDELELYRYLREAIANGDTQFKGGLMLSSLIRLGEWANTDTDKPTMAKVWSGMNGLYKNGRTIANWWGGDMVDLFDENDNLIVPAPANAAAGLVRMDGSYYYSNGNIGGRADGSVWVGGVDGLKIDKNGHITLGSGIHIGTGDGTNPTTLASILNFINNLTKLIVPVNEQKEEIPWSHPNVADCYALKAKKGLYAMGFLSAHGLNAEGGGAGSAGISYSRLDDWADYDADKSGWVLSALLGHDLHTRLTAIEGDYVKLSDLPSLSGYATEQWVLSKGYITQDALTPYLKESDAESNYLPLAGGTMLNTNLVSNLNADMLDGAHADDIRKSVLAFKIFRGTSTTGGYDLNTLAPEGGLVTNYGSTDYWGNAPQNAMYGMALHFKGNNNLGGMLFADINHGSTIDVTRRLWWRASGTVNGQKTWGQWHQIAFTDGNVASATKLADNATYTAWGRPLFANGKPQNVSGNLTGSNFLLNDNGTNPYLQFTHDYLNWYVQAWNGKMFVGAGASNSIQIDRNGNLSIGLASSVAPAYKLDVNGTAKISEGLLIGGLLSANGGISTTAITATEIHLGGLTLKYNASNKGLQVSGGGLYTDSYLSAHGPSPTAVDYEARIAALETKIAQLESRLNA